ncbi:MAG: penicillin-insensitive murein endopeptidase [Nannocystaceae bacterium]|nr:penicillin-insensitive murein endopeptidase [Nannocystaceae bacterium]
MLMTVLGVGLNLLAPSLDGASTRIRYTMQGGEVLRHLADRYGTGEAALRRDNPGKLERGRVLTLQATRLPPPWQRLRVTVGERDDWSTLADRYGLLATDLRAWNPRASARKRLRSGTTLVMWLPSGATLYPLPDDATGFPDVPKPERGESVGRPNRGRLVDGAALPAGPYVIRFDWQKFGSALTVWNLARVLRAFRAETGFEGELFVGAISRRNGRRLPPHRSHQSGRDVDVRLPAMPHAEGFKLDVDEVDWHATWALVDAFVRTGDVQVIFLERKLRRRLKRAGLALGANDERIAHVMGSVRHSPGHTAHVHVRFRCAASEARCRD